MNLAELLEKLYLSPILHESVKVSYETLTFPEYHLAEKIRSRTVQVLTEEDNSDSKPVGFHEVVELEWTKPERFFKRSYYKLQYSPTELNADDILYEIDSKKEFTSLEDSEIEYVEINENKLLYNASARLAMSEILLYPFTLLACCDINSIDEGEVLFRRTYEVDFITRPVEISFGAKELYLVYATHHLVNIDMESGIILKIHSFYADKLIRKQTVTHFSVKLSG